MKGNTTRIIKSSQECKYIKHFIYKEYPWPRKRIWNLSFFYFIHFRSNPTNYWRNRSRTIKRI